MIRRTIRLVWRGAVIGFLAYAFFFARLGERTPFQHVMRIAATNEARELGQEVGAATRRITSHIGDQVLEAAASDGVAPVVESDDAAPFQDAVVEVSDHDALVDVAPERSLP